MTRHATATLIIALSAGLPIASSARAQQPGEHTPNPGGPRPARASLLQIALDKNKDGELSREEIAAASVSLLSLDKNKDRKLAGDELRPPPPPVGPTVAELVARLMEFDGDANGVLTRDELPDQLADVFAQADTNRDSRLTDAELTSLVEKQEAEAKAREAARPAPPAPKEGPRPVRVSPLQAALDTDADGEISAAEITAAAASLRSLDKNNDGIVGAEELRPPTPPEAPRPADTAAAPKGT